MSNKSTASHPEGTREATTSNGDTGAEEEETGKNEIVQEAEERSRNRTIDRNETLKATITRNALYARGHDHGLPV